MSAERAMRVFSLDDDARREARSCPGCGRIMTFREAMEQDACNDCWNRFPIEDDSP